MIYVQRFSWWDYHWLLLYLPTALLAVLGVDKALDWLARKVALTDATLAVVTALLVASPVLMLLEGAAGRVGPFARASAAFVSGEPDVMARFSEGGFASARDISGAIAPLAASDTLFVMGDPRIYQFLGKTQAVPIHGWGLEFISNSLWRQLEADLRLKEPSAVFVASFYRGWISDNSSGIAAWLQSDYVASAETPSGTWYLRRNEGAGLAQQGGQ